MRKLILINTYYQFIFAVQLKATLLNNTDVVLLISDHSINAEFVSKNICETHFFEEVYYVHTLGSGDKRNSLQKIEDFIQITFCKQNRYKFYINNIENLYFNEILVFNYDISIYGLYSLLVHYNKQIKISRFEESVLNYNSVIMQTARRELISCLRKIQKKPYVEKALKNFYCFYPELYSGRLNPVSVPQIKRTKEMIKTLQTAFALDLRTVSYSEKYIFFTSVYDFEGGEAINEYQLVCEISKFVGKKNLLVKIHPRDKRTIYCDNKFNVDKNSFVPWEVIQLSYDFSDKIFITATSGSVLAGSLMFECKTKTYYMFNCCNLLGNPSAQKTVSEIQKLLKNPLMSKRLENVRVVKRVEEILE